MAIGVNWAEIWATDVWAEVWAQEAEVPDATPAPIAPTYGEWRLSDRRHKEFKEFLDEGREVFDRKERAKAEALERDRLEAEAKEFAKHTKELERARARREAEVLKALAKLPVEDRYPRQSLTGSATLAPASLKGSLSGERPVQGGLRASTAILGSLSGEQSIQAVSVSAPVLTGRASRELEDDAIALALGMPELAEILGEYVRI